MSLLNAVANCRKPIGEDKARKVYYSKKYNVVIKRAKPDFIKNHYNQNLIEVEMLEKLNNEDKKIIPIIQSLTRPNGEVVTIWEKVETLQSKIKNIDDDELKEIASCTIWWHGSMLRKRMQTVITKLNLENNFHDIIALISKCNLDDIKSENLGILNNRLVIIDAGWDTDAIWR